MGKDRKFPSEIWVNIEFTELRQKILVDNLGEEIIFSGIIWGKTEYSLL